MKGSKTKDYHRASPVAVAVLNKVKLIEYIYNQLRWVMNDLLLHLSY